MDCAPPAAALPFPYTLHPAPFTRSPALVVCVAFVGPAFIFRRAAPFLALAFELGLVAPARVSGFVLANPEIKKFQGLMIQALRGK